MLAPHWNTQRKDTMRYCEAEAAALQGFKHSTKVVALILAARTSDNTPDWPGRHVSFPSIETLERDTGLKKRALQYALRELADAKVIRIYKDRRPGARWDHNVYEWTATESPNYNPDWKKTPDPRQDSIGSRLTEDGWRYCRANNVGPNMAAATHPEFVTPQERPTIIGESKPAEEASLDVDAAPTPAPTPSVPEKPIQEPSDGFDDWWRQYPKKVAKIDAQTAYRAALKRGVTPQELLNGLQRHNANWKARNTERQYIPNPATWLRRGRWEDELDTPSNDTPAPAVNPNTGRPLTKQDFYEACIKHGIDYTGIINFWQPHMGLPGDPDWPHWEAQLNRHCGRA